MRPGSGCGYREACCHGISTLLSPWTGRDGKGEGCERKQQVERKRGKSWWSEQACGYPSFQFLLWRLHLVPLWNECLVSDVPLCWCIVSYRSEGGSSTLLNVVRGAVELVWHPRLFGFFKSQTV